MWAVACVMAAASSCLPPLSPPGGRGAGDERGEARIHAVAHLGGGGEFPPSLPASPPPEGERGGTADDEDIPLVGRPAEFPFADASARFVRRDGEFVAPFALTSSVSPREIAPGGRMTLTVTVRALGPVRKPPTRIDLGEVFAFKTGFTIEDVPEGAVARPDASTWVWTYRVRPVRRRPPREVPGVPFVYYNPDLRPVDRAFQVIWTDPLPIRVTEEDRLTAPPAMPKPAETWPDDFAPSPPPWRPGPIAWVFALAAPGIAVALGRYLWLRAHPDAARVARLRAGRSLREALDSLGAADPRDAEALARSLLGYLAERFGLAVREPTPAEASAVVPESVRADTAELIDLLARVRFRGVESPSDLRDRVRSLLLRTEETCSPSS